MDPLVLIDIIKMTLKEVLEENNLTYNELDMESILSIYSYNLVKILINYYPGATIMMNKNYKECAVLIQGVIYNGYGIANRSDYFIAGKEELNYIKNSFKKISDLTASKLNQKFTDGGNKKLLYKCNYYV